VCNSLAPPLVDIIKEKSPSNLGTPLPRMLPYELNTLPSRKEY